MSIKIAIPSYKRPNDVTTISWIPLEYHENIYLFVRAEEYAAYAAKYSTVNIVQLSNVNNIGETRQRIVEHLANEKLWMIDDDVFLHRSFVDKSKWRGYHTIRAHKKIPVGNADFYDAIEFIEDQMRLGFVHGSYLPAIFPRNTLNYPTRINTWSFSNTFLDLTRIPTDLLVYEKMDQLEDMYQWLTLCKAGFDSVTMINFLTSSSKSNSPGGCSSYRNVTNFNNACNKILKDFPEYTFRRSSPHSLNFKDEETRISIQAKINRYPDKDTVESRKTLTY